MSAPFGGAAETAGIFARAGSVPVGIVEERIWKPFGRTKEDAWAFVDALLGAAKALDYDTKKAGDRMGALGPSGLKVLEALLSFTDFLKVRMEPTIAAIAAKAKLARGTVVRALNRLDKAGFLSWVRRKVELDNDGPGPQIHQTSNAYFIQLRGRALGLVKLLLKKRKPPPPDDHLAARDQDREAVDDMLTRTTSENVARFRAGDSPLGEALASLGRALDSSAISTIGRNPDRQNK